jgi:hypothetical protein
MSDDTYTFEFRPLDVGPKVQSYLEFSGEDLRLLGTIAASLARTLENRWLRRCPAVWKLRRLSHRSASSSPRPSGIVSLRAQFGRSRILHIPVLVNLDEHLGRSRRTGPDPSICFLGCGHRGCSASIASASMKMAS